MDATAHGIVSSLKKQYTRRDKICLDSGYYDTETWGALKKCWRGYKIAKSESDYKNMEYYAKGIATRQVKGLEGHEHSSDFLCCDV